MRDNSEDNTFNKSNNATNRKRSRSFDPSEGNGREKMQKIDEDDETSGNKDNDDDDDILSFAKKTLQQEDLPETEDIFKNIPRLIDCKLGIIFLKNILISLGSTTTCENCPRDFLSPNIVHSEFFGSRFFY